MLTRLEIQNYRAIEKLEIDFAPTNLLMGLNGSGKTTIFDALAAIRAFIIDGARCDEVFPLESVPRWKRTSVPQVFEQSFRVRINGPDGFLEYNLTIEQNEKRGSSRVRIESFLDAGGQLFNFDEGKVTLYRDDHSEGPKYSSDWNASAMKLVPSGPDNHKMVAFKKRLRQTYCLRIDPPGISARSEKEASELSRHAENFASWYRRALIANASAGAEFLNDVRNVIGGLASLNLSELGQGIMVLQAEFRNSATNIQPGGAKTARPYRLDFNELSHGQQSLIILYALLHFLSNEGATLCIDEPDNFVALAEIQPWLFRVQDRIADHGAQIILASHHPELLNLLASDCGIVLERDGSGPTTVRPFSNDGSELSPAERIARGWERD